MTPLLEVKDIVKIYGKRRVVNGVTFHVNAGEIVGLLGRNGAGKTTTFRCTVGMTRPNGGQVLFEGKNITNLPMYKRARLGVGYLSQEPSVFQRLSVLDNLLSIMEMFSVNKKKLKTEAIELLEDFGLEHLAASKANTLSGGERRRLEIARALVNRPKLILLDEPFSGVDPIAVSEIQAIIRVMRKQGMGILLTDHNVRETLAITDRSYLIDEGKVEVEGKPAEILDNTFAREHYLGKDFKM